VVSVVLAGGAKVVMVLAVVVWIVNKPSISVVVPGLVGNSVGQVAVLLIVVVSGTSFEVSRRVVFIFGVVVRLTPSSLLDSVVVVTIGRGVGVSVILFIPSR